MVQSQLVLPLKISKLFLIQDQAIFGFHQNSVQLLLASVTTNMIKLKAQLIKLITLILPLIMDQEVSKDIGHMIQ